MFTETGHNNFNPVAHKQDNTFQILFEGCSSRHLQLSSAGLQAFTCSENK
jgi:hypothetical protein